MVPKLEFVRGFEGIDGLFVNVVGFFVVTTGRFVVTVVLGLLVLGFLVVVCISGLTDVVFLGGNLVEGTTFCVVVAKTFFIVVAVDSC